MSIDDELPRFGVCSLRAKSCFPRPIEGLPEILALGLVGWELKTIRMEFPEWGIVSDEKNSWCFERRQRKCMWLSVERIDYFICESIKFELHEKISVVIAWEDYGGTLQRRRKHDQSKEKSTVQWGACIYVKEKKKGNKKNKAHKCVYTSMSCVRDLIVGTWLKFLMQSQSY